jgi:hypothetical protein
MSKSLKAKRSAEVLAFASKADRVARASAVAAALFGRVANDTEDALEIVAISVEGKIPTRCHFAGETFITRHIPRASA